LPSPPALDTSPSHIIMLVSIILATVFPTFNHIYSTFASPIVEGLFTTSNATPTHSPAKRVYWTPPDQKCATPAQWDSRRCLPKIGDRAWEDLCLSSDPGIAGVVRYVVTSCAEHTMCSNVITNYRESIVCIGRPSVGTVTETGQQSGFVSVQNTLDVNQEIIESVTLVTGISLASVSAFLEGKY
jgi:hypothetical protein